MRVEHTKDVDTLLLTRSSIIHHKIKQTRINKQRPMLEDSHLVFDNSEFEYEEMGGNSYTAYRFHKVGSPKIDYYPSTGRWRIVDTFPRGKTLGGGPVEFIKWYTELLGKVGV